MDRAFEGLTELVNNLHQNLGTTTFILVLIFLVVLAGPLKNFFNLFFLNIVFPILYKLFFEWIPKLFYLIVSIVSKKRSVPTMRTHIDNVDFGIVEIEKVNRLMDIVRYFVMVTASVILIFTLTTIVREFIEDYQSPDKSPEITERKSEEGSSAKTPKPDNNVKNNVKKDTGKTKASTKKKDTGKTKASTKKKEPAKTKASTKKKTNNKKKKPSERKLRSWDIR